MKQIPWQMCKDGYQRALRRVEEGREFLGNPEWVLIPNAPAEVVSAFDFVVRNEPGLFLAFAKLPPEDGEAHREFANRYGLLGLPVQVEEPGSSAVSISRPGEREADWAAAIKEMKRATRLWEYCQANNRDALQKLLFPDTVPNSQEVAWWWYTGETKSSGDSDNMPMQSRGVPFSPNDFGTPALLFLCRWVNRGLQGHVQQALVYDAKRSRPILTTRANSLLGFMWLQLARAVAQGETVRMCEVCQKPFLVKSKMDRRTERKRYCSGNCKIKFFRKRKAEAAPVTGKKTQDGSTPMPTKKNATGVGISLVRPKRKKQS